MVSPKDFGDFEAQREWVLRMDSLVYKAPPLSISSPRPVLASAAPFTIRPQNGLLVLSAATPGMATLFTTAGRKIEDKVIAKAGSCALGSTSGCYLVRFRSAAGTGTLWAVNY